MIVHWVDDVQIFLALAGGWAIASFAVCRAKYGEDWFAPWFTMTKVVSLLALAVVAENERRMILAWWAAAPILVSTGTVSMIAWWLTRRSLRRQAQNVVLDLEFRGDTVERGSIGARSRVLFYWGAANLVMIVSSFLIAAMRGGR